MREISRFGRSRRHYGQKISLFADGVKIMMMI
jgi:hypothetical protein